MRWGCCLAATYPNTILWLIEIDKNRIDKILRDGVTIQEADLSENIYHPQAALSPEGLPTMDLLIVFVKSMFTISALEANKDLIGKDTYLMTLQNGAGHEAKLLQFADEAHVIIGSTQHNSSVIENGRIKHGGAGITSIGLLEGETASIRHIANAFNSCGIECIISDSVREQIWNKLFLNTSASALTAVLQVPLGFILEDPSACSLMEALAREAVTVANAGGISAFCADDVIEDIKKVLGGAKGGYTSIYADVKKGARSEVDTISGSVVEAARGQGIAVPYHDMVVKLIHAMEHKMKENIG